MRVQRICEIISTKSPKIAIRENLDPQKFSAIQYYWKEEALVNVLYFLYRYRCSNLGKSATKLLCVCLGVEEGWGGGGGRIAVHLATWLRLGMGTQSFLK